MSRGRPRGSRPPHSVDDRLLVPGNQPEEVFARVMERLGHPVRLRPFEAADVDLPDGGRLMDERPARTGYLSLGANVGDRRAELQAAVDALPAAGVRVTASSSTYETEPVGEILDQPDFLNACVRIRTEHDPEELVLACKGVERALGRAPGGPRHGPRAIDVDVLLLGDLTYASPRLRLPHPEILERRFVLVPLLELDPELEVPGHGSAGAALARLGPGQAVRRAGAPLTSPRTFSDTGLMDDRRRPLEPQVRIARQRPDSVLAAELLGRYYAELGERFNHGFDLERTVAAPPTELIPPHGAFLVAWLGERPVGCGAVRKLDEAIAEIKRMWVASDARGHGIGRRLLTSLEHAAAELGCPTVRLDTSADLPEALTLYRSAGYREIPAYNNNPYAAHWLEKRSDPS